MPLVNLWNWLRADPRHGQIATLGLLLAYGLGWLGFDLTAGQAIVTIVAAVTVQFAVDRYTGRPLSGTKSALISALSLGLLLRTNDLRLAVIAALVAVLSKFVVRARGKHVFNPTNLALVALLATTVMCWPRRSMRSTHTRSLSSSCSVRRISQLSSLSVNSTLAFRS